MPLNDTEEKVILHTIEDLTRMPDIDGGDIPSYCSVKDIADETEIDETDIIDIAKKNNFSVYKINPSEAYDGSTIIADPDVNVEDIKAEYKQFYDIEPEIEIIFAGKSNQPQKMSAEELADLEKQLEKEDKLPFDEGAKDDASLWTRICKAYCDKFGYEFAFANWDNQDLGYKTKDGTLVHKSALDLKKELTESLNESKPDADDKDGYVISYTIDSSETTDAPFHDPTTHQEGFVMKDKDGQLGKCAHLEDAYIYPTSKDAYDDLGEAKSKLYIKDTIFAVKSYKLASKSLEESDAETLKKLKDAISALEFGKESYEKIGQFWLSTSIHKSEVNGDEMTNIQLNKGQKNIAFFTGAVTKEEFEEFKRELIEDLGLIVEDVVKQGDSWVNKGKEGTHGKFNTKKQANAQRKAMFANGFKESAEQDKLIKFDPNSPECMRDIDEAASLDSWSVYYSVDNTGGLDKLLRKYIDDDALEDAYNKAMDDYKKRTDDALLYEDAKPASKFVLYKDGDKIMGTDSANYDAQLADARKIHDFTSFGSVKDIIDYLVKYGHITKEDVIVKDGLNEGLSDSVTDTTDTTKLVTKEEDKPADKPVDKPTEKPADKPTDVPAEKPNKDDEPTNSAAIDKYIDDLYEMRKQAIAKDGEFGIGNLVFKELRNLGYLDNLKELRNELRSKELSLEPKTKEEANKTEVTEEINVAKYGTKEEIKELAAKADKDGTYSVDDEGNITPVPFKTGFQVSFFRPEITNDEIRSVLNAIGDKLGEKYFGLWKDGGEISYHIDNEANAYKLAKIFNQETIMDWSKYGTDKQFPANPDYDKDKKVDYKEAVKQFQDFINNKESAPAPVDSKEEK